VPANASPPAPIPAFLTNSRRVTAVADQILDEDDVLSARIQVADDDDTLLAPARDGHVFSLTR
jgi:hypothetical protein